jgi:hypothetical protein
MTESTPLRALALVCTLSPSPAESSSELMARQVLDELAKHGVSGDVVRLVDLDETPEAVASTTATLAENAAVLARALEATPYPRS